jgi:hypothetical protein
MTLPAIIARTVSFPDPIALCIRTPRKPLGISTLFGDDPSPFAATHVCTLDAQRSAAKRDAHAPLPNLTFTPHGPKEGHLFETPQRDTNRLAAPDPDLDQVFS